MKELSDQMRTAAEIVEKVAYLYNLNAKPAGVALSADWLRHEADVLDAPIPEDADD